MTFLERQIGLSIWDDVDSVQSRLSVCLRLWLKLEVDRSEMCNVSSSKAASPR